MSERTRPLVAVTDAGALGRAVTARMVADGWDVAIYHPPWMDAHAASIQEANGAGPVFVRRIDGDDRRSLALAVEATRERFGRAPSHALLVFDELLTDGPVHHGHGAGDTCARLTTSNVDTVYRSLHVLLPSMVADRHGSVVVMGSRLAQRPWDGAGAAAFTAAKAATLALVQAVAQEVIESGVRVNAILEGIVDEPGARGCMPHADHSRWVSLDSLVAVIAFLFSDDARAISGAGIPLHGRS
jgi:NAD(P)-dependent dehydrogenase (short-subunit alcohol dehydrogenase family)